MAAAVIVILLVFGSQIPPAPGASGGVPICTCDLLPGNCDLNCCCDPNCHLSSPASVFSSCLPGSTKYVSAANQISAWNCCGIKVNHQHSLMAERWLCTSNWLIFRNNTPYTTARVGSPPSELFCVLSDDASLNYFVTPRKVDAADFLSVSKPYAGPSFSPSSQGVPAFSSLYRAGDPILTISTSGTVGVLSQPASTSSGNICADTNPAKFLQDLRTSCLRVLSNLSVSCVSEPRLDAAHYYRNISVLKVPSDASNPAANPIPVSSSVSPRPVLQGDRCLNVVTQVTYTVHYNGSQGIVSVSADFILGSLSGSSLQQTFITVYKSVSAPASSSVQTRSGNPGYLVGYPVLSDIGPLSVPRSQGGESCSSSPLLFGMNSLGGCILRGAAQKSCSDLQAGAYQMLLPGGTPQSLAVFGNATPTQSDHWTPIIHQNCSGQGDCSAGCPVPVLLDIQILWANVGLLSNPQAQLLRARYLYTCRRVKCEDSTILQTRVSFTDLSSRGPAPRSSPGITGRDPTDFFPFRSRAALTCPGNPTLTLLMMMNLLLGVW